MDNIELILTDLGEEATKLLTEEKRPKGLEENIKLAHLGATSAKKAKEDIEKNLNKKIVTQNNKLSYQYQDEIPKITQNINQKP